MIVITFWLLLVIGAVELMHAFALYRRAHWERDVVTRMRLDDAAWKVGGLGLLWITGAAAVLILDLWW